MRKLGIIFLLLFTVQIFALELKKLNLPGDWKIESTNKQESVSLGEISVPKYTKQVITTPNGELIVHHYYFNGDVALKKQIFSYFLNNKKAAYIGKDVVYSLEGEDVDVKNTLRFLELPLLQQVKLVYPDIVDIENVALESEVDLTSEEVSEAGKKFGVEIKKAIVQIYTHQKSKAKLQAIYFFCKNKVEAKSAFNTARIKNNDKLINYLFAEDFLVQLSWVK